MHAIEGPDPEVPHAEAINAMLKQPCRLFGFVEDFDAKFRGYLKPADQQ